MTDFATTDDYERLMIVVRGGRYLLESDRESHNEASRFQYACNIQVAYRRLSEDSSPYQYQLTDEDARIVRVAQGITGGPFSGRPS